MSRIIRKVFSLFTPREKQRFLILMCMVLVMGVFELAGVASILPFLAVVTSPDLIDSNGFLSRLRDLTGITEAQTFMVFLGGCVMATVAVSLSVKIFTLYALARFSHMRQFTFGRRLLEGYLSHPYVWFLDKHSADLVRTVNGEVNTVVTGVIIPLTQLIAQGTVLIMIVGLLLVVDPVVAIVAIAMMGGTYALIFLLVRKRLTQMGAIRVTSNRERAKATLEALGSLKDVKLMGLEDSYVKRFRVPALRAARAATMSQIISEMPRHLLEVVAFGGILSLIMTKLIRSDGSLAETLPVLGLFAFAGLRLFPALQAVYRSMTAIRFNEPTLDLVHTAVMDVENYRANRPARAKGEPWKLQESITLNGVSYTYPSTDIPVLRNMTLTIPARTTVGIVGGTGAGKTTAIDIILGLLTPDEGALEVDGTAIDRSNVRQWQMAVGYVPQQIFLVDDSIAANIAFGVPLKERDQNAVERAAKMAELHDFILDLPEGYDTRVGDRGVRLSGGQRQRIAIARTLYHDPDVLVFDEATSALDNLTEQAVMDAIHKLSHSKTVIMIAHRLSTVEECDTIFLLEHGRVADAGRFDDLKQSSETFRRMARENREEEDALAARSSEGA